MGRRWSFPHSRTSRCVSRRASWSGAKTINTSPGSRPTRSRESPNPNWATNVIGPAGPCGHGAPFGRKGRPPIFVIRGSGASPAAHTNTSVGTVRCQPASQRVRRASYDQRSRGSSIHDARGRWPRQLRASAVTSIRACNSPRCLRTKGAKPGMDEPLPILAAWPHKGPGTTSTHGAHSTTSVPSLISVLRAAHGATPRRIAARVAARSMRA